ncbi:capsular biosynthesis protein [Paenibacillus selenitireducens]|uniref:non-specific protein-tyrosine kinase n=2 Tax=Paenibacillus selenitireducens TaxID=1324314 RepID=A0A1T2XLN1_9BACL|nr:capsular biosynthesis protein [Paenibacillus selenitireducens]
MSNPKSPVAEAYRSLRTNIDFSSIDEEIRVIMVTSSGPEEGKSTTLANLAVSYAQSDKKVVVIDGDMRRPTCHHTFNLSNQSGLSSIVTGQIEMQQAIKATEVDNLFVITSGPLPPNPSELLGSKRMNELLEQLKMNFDIIIIDTPPVLAVTDAQIISSKCDGVVLVIHSGKVKRDMAIKAKASLDHVRARILGVVLNNVKHKKEDMYYYYYGQKD